MGKKKPRAAFKPAAAKQPAIGRAPSSSGERPSWRFRKLDKGGPFCWSVMGEPDLTQVLALLCDLETMTWHEIATHQHHYLPGEALTSEAVKRLEQLRMDDEIDHIFSLRLTSAKRVIGVRHDAVLHFLWWDPDHGVAKSGYKK